MDRPRRTHFSVLEDDRPDHDKTDTATDMFEDDRDDGGSRNKNSGVVPETDYHQSEQPGQTSADANSRLPPLSIATRRAILLEWAQNVELTSVNIAQKYELGSRITASRVRREYGLPAKPGDPVFDSSIFLNAARRLIEQHLPPENPHEIRDAIAREDQPGWLAQVDGLYPWPHEGYQQLDAALTYYLRKAGLKGPDDLQTRTDAGRILHVNMPVPVFNALHLALAGRGAFLNRRVIRRPISRHVVQRGPERQELEAMAVSLSEPVLAIFYETGFYQSHVILPLAAKTITGHFLDRRIEAAAQVVIINPLPEQSSDKTRPVTKAAKARKNPDRELTFAERFAQVFPTLASLMPVDVLASQEALWQRISKVGLGRAQFDKDLTALLKTRQICNYPRLNLAVLPMIFVREFGRSRPPTQIFVEPEFTEQLSKLADLTDKSRRFARLLEIKSVNAANRADNPILDQQTLSRWMAKNVKDIFRSEILRFYAKPPTACPVVNGQLTPAAAEIKRKFKIEDSEITEIFKDEYKPKPIKPSHDKKKKRAAAATPR